MVQQDDHEGLCQIRNLTKDLCGQNVVLLNSTVLREMLNITIDILYEAISVSFCRCSPVSLLLLVCLLLDTASFRCWLPPALLR